MVVVFQLIWRLSAGMLYSGTVTEAINTSAIVVETEGPSLSVLLLMF
jgi:hypothetical protein